MSRVLVAMFAVLLLAPVVSTAQVVDGVQVGPEPPNQPVREYPVGTLATDLNFDDRMYPCVFAETVAASDEYQAFGVVFSGPGGNDGGAFLDECGGFGVSGHSSPNFLAFNVNSMLSDGGIPRGPETLTFTPEINSISILGGHSSSGTVTMECFDSGGGSLGTDTIAGSSTLQTLEVIAGGISYCVLSFTGNVAVFDNLSFDPIPVELQSFTVE